MPPTLSDGDQLITIDTTNGLVTLRLTIKQRDYLVSIFHHHVYSPTGTDVEVVDIGDAGVRLRR